MEPQRKRLRSAAGNKFFSITTPVKTSRQPQHASSSPASPDAIKPEASPARGINAAAEGSPITTKAAKKLKPAKEERIQVAKKEEEEEDDKIKLKDELAKDDPFYDAKVEDKLKKGLQSWPDDVNEKYMDLPFKHEDEAKFHDLKPNKRRKILVKREQVMDLKVKVQVKCEEPGVKEESQKDNKTDSDGDHKMENAGDKLDRCSEDEKSSNGQKAREFRIPTKFVKNEESPVAIEEKQQVTEASQENPAPVLGDLSKEDSTPKTTEPAARQTRGKGRRIEVTPVPLEELETSTRIRRPSRKATEAGLADGAAEEPAVEDEYSPSKRGRKGAARLQGKGKPEIAITKQTLESPKKPARKSVWDRETLLTSKKSKLAKAYDLSSLLNSATWDLLSQEEQAECLALLPTIDKVYSTEPDGQPKEHLVSDFFESNQVFRDSLTEFQEDLLAGRCEPGYLAMAAKARAARLEGAADIYKDGQYELYWGQRMRGHMVAGAAAQIKMPELISRGILRAGDIWEYKRNFKMGKGKAGDVCLEKRIKVISVNPDHSLNFAVPPGGYKFSNASREDLIVEHVVAPQTIESVILKTHTRTPDHVPNGNAYKCFNIWRNGEDLGALWEIRQTYWGGS